MAKYLKTEEVLKLLNIEIFELADFCKKGELQAYNEYGHKIVDPDSCEKTTKYSYDEIKFAIRMKEGPKPEGDSLRRRFTEERIRKEAREIYDVQPLDVPIIPKGCYEFNFSLPTNKVTAKQKINEIVTFLFKKRDIIKYINEDGSHKFDKVEKGIEKQKSTSTEIQIEISKQDADSFMRNVTIYPIGDEDLKIKTRRKNFMTFTSDRMGKKQWKTLKEILDKPKHIYSLGPARDELKRTINAYYRRLDRLKQISKNFVAFLYNEFEAGLPLNSFLFELCHEEGKGVYKPKFQIAGSSVSENRKEKYRKMPEKKFHTALYKLVKNSRSTPPDQTEDSLTEDLLAAI